MITLYFLIFDCFNNNLSANKTYNEFKSFQEHIPVDNISLSNIQKLFRILRKKIKIKMHMDWLINPLGTEPSSGGVARVEIDESKLIGNNNIVYYMFGMIDSCTKNAHVYCVLDNHTKESLLHNKKRYIYL